VTSPITARRAQRRVRAGDIVHDDRGEALELGAEIGRGGQGVVWSLAGGLAAVKILKAQAGGSADRLGARLAMVRRFDLTGIPIARPLSLLVGGDVGYTMELLSGMTAIGTMAAPREPVREWFQATGGLGRRLRLLALAAEALGSLQARGLSYGDVSDGNILVSGQTGHDQVWLIDPDNLSAAASISDSAHITRGYAAPELQAGRAGQDSLTDAFAFAILAFQVLALAHPFIGDRADGDDELTELAFSGKLPWIGHPTDDRNRASQVRDLDLVLTKGLRRLCARAFEDGLRDPRRRPSVREWHDKLDQAALLMLSCPGCGGTYHSAAAVCPWCRRQSRPPVLRCDIHGHVPAGQVPGGADSASESGRLRSLILAAGQPRNVPARTGLLCLDRGPAEYPADPSEPLVELSWDGGLGAVIQRTGRHPVWLVNQSARREIPLGVGETWSISLAETAQWTVNFGPQSEIHRFMRILTSRSGTR
jgi:eukaryotic-like serine/threonine-protein kinase